jgi:hypothetical protein
MRVTIVTLLTISSLGESEAPVAATLTPRQRRQVASRWNAEPVPFFLGVDHESALLLAAADAGLAAATSDIPALVAAVWAATEEKPWLWLRARLNLILVDLNLGRLRAAAGNASALRKELHAGMSGQPVLAWTAASTAEHEAAVQGTRELLPTVMQAELYLWAELRADEEHDGDVVRLAMGIGRTVASDTAGAYAALPLLPLRAAQMLEMVAVDRRRSSSSQLDADISALWRAAAGGVLGTGDVMKLALVSTSGRPYQRAVRASGGPTAEAAARTDYSALEARSAWQAHAGDGGWLHHQHGPAGSADTESRCDIDRRSDLTTAELLDEYVKEGRPVLLRGLLDGWPVRRWERRSVLSRLGNHSVLVRSSGFIAAARSTGGFRSRDAAAGGTSMQLRDFATAMRAHTAAAGQEEEEEEQEQVTDAGYVFTSEDSLVVAGEDFDHPVRKRGRSFPMFCSKPVWANRSFSKRKLIQTPPFLQPLFFTDQSGSDAETEAGADSVLPWTPSEREQKAIFCLGQRGSGIGFHHHSNALNALVFGRKR